MAARAATCPHRRSPSAAAALSLSRRRGHLTLALTAVRGSTTPGRRTAQHTPSGQRQTTVTALPSALGGLYACGGQPQSSPDPAPIKVMQRTREAGAERPGIPGQKRGALRSSLQPQAGAGPPGSSAFAPPLEHSSVPPSSSLHHCAPPAPAYARHPPTTHPHANETHGRKSLRRGSEVRSLSNHHAKEVRAGRPPTGHSPSAPSAQSWWNDWGPEARSSGA